MLTLYIISTFSPTWMSKLNSLPCLNGVNLKSGRYFRSLALLAVFLNWPSDLVVSYLTSPLKSIASTTASAASLMLTSSSSPTKTHRKLIYPWSRQFDNKIVCYFALKINVSSITKIWNLYINISESA